MVRSLWGVEQKHLIDYFLVENLGVEFLKVDSFGANSKFIGLVHLNELLGVVDLLTEEHEIGHLADEVVADRDLL